MHAQTTQRALLSAMAIAMKAVPTKSSLPILGNVLITVDADGKMTLSSTNLEIGLVVPVETQPLIDAEAGTITVNAKRLQEWLQTLKKADVIDLRTDRTETKELVKGDDGKQVVVVHNGETLTVKVPHPLTRATMKGISADEFPTMPIDADVLPDLADGASIVLPVAVAHAWNRDVVYAASTDDSRPIFTGLNFKMDREHNTLVVAAADSFRLAVLRTPLAFVPPAETFPDFIVPATSIKTLASILPDAGNVTISVEMGPDAFGKGRQVNRIVFTCDAFVMMTNCVAGAFPNYEAIIPRDTTTTLTFVAEDVRLAFKRANMISQAGSRKVTPTVRLTVMGEGVVRVKSSNTDEATETEQELSCEMSSAIFEEGSADKRQRDEDGCLYVILNGKYITDFLAACETTRFVWSFRDGVTAQLLTPVYTDATPDGATPTPATVGEVEYVTMAMHSTK